MGQTNTKPPLVSVSIATYNRAHLIAQSIESVLNQTFKDYEIIIVDDGSSDNTEEMLRKKFGESIVYIGKKRNEGLSAARNTGIKAARGKYFAILDDDDAWFPEKLEMQMGLMEKQPSLGLVYCNSLIVNEHDEVLGEIKGTKRGAIFDELLSYNCLGPPSGILLPKEVFAQTGYFDETLPHLMDWDLWIRVSQHYEIDFIDQPLIRYKVHSDNMSKNIMDMQHTTFIVLDKYWPHVCEEKNSEEERNRVYSNHCLNFAWKEYGRGNSEAFRDLVLKALEYDTSHQIVLQGEDLQGKEKVFFEVFNDFWNEINGPKNKEKKKKSYSAQYIQLAWEYYHQGCMNDFRRCVGLACYHSFPNIPLRLAVPFIKSFLGKGIADAIHQVRKRVLHA